MMDGALWTMFVILLLFLMLIVISNHCAVLGRRIDLVHKRISQICERNGLDNGEWDD